MALNETLYEGLGKKPRGKILPSVDLTEEMGGIPEGRDLSTLPTSNPQQINSVWNTVGAQKTTAVEMN